MENGEWRSENSQEPLWAGRLHAREAPPPDGRLQPIAEFLLIFVFEF
jgi:hypothetical protein